MGGGQGLDHVLEGGHWVADTVCYVRHRDPCCLACDLLCFVPFHYDDQTLCLLCNDAPACVACRVKVLDTVWS